MAEFFVQVVCHDDRIESEYLEDSESEAITRAATLRGEIVRGWYSDPSARVRILCDGEVVESPLTRGPHDY